MLGPGRVIVSALSFIFLLCKIPLPYLIYLLCESGVYGTVKALNHQISMTSNHINW